jgi:hypothetical protein
MALGDRSKIHRRFGVVGNVQQRLRPRMAGRGCPYLDPELLCHFLVEIPGVHRFKLLRVRHTVAKQNATTCLSAACRLLAQQHRFQGQAELQTAPPVGKCGREGAPPVRSADPRSSPAPWRAPPVHSVQWRSNFGGPIGRCLGARGAQSPLSHARGAIAMPAGGHHLRAEARALNRGRCIEVFRKEDSRGTSRTGHFDAATRSRRHTGGSVAAVEERRSGRISPRGGCANGRRTSNADAVAARHPFNCSAHHTCMVAPAPSPAEPATDSLLPHACAPPRRPLFLHASTTTTY